MTIKTKDQIEDDEFDAFLKGQGELAQQLQALPRSVPSAALDAAILAQVTANLARNGVQQKNAAPVAANDASIPGGAGNSRPSFLSRWRSPVGMAASLVIGLFIMLQWQQQNLLPVIVAQAPQASPSSSTSTPVIQIPQVAVSDAAKMSEPIPAPTTLGAAAVPQAKTAAPAAATKPLSSPEKEAAPTMLAATPQADTAPGSSVALRKSDAGPATQIAQADISEFRAKSAPASVVAAAPPAVVPSAPAVAAAAPAMASAAGGISAEQKTAVAASNAVPAPIVDVAKAKAWLGLIEEMLKADLRQDALAEWEKFRKAYPTYPAPEKLEARIKALKK
ncbi:hypothetical protein BH11PSE12_BH11PSE12_34050 [soil metagenome]